MKEKALASRGPPRRPVPNMDSFISCFHASSLNSHQIPQPSQPPATNNYCYIPGQYWQTLDYYDMAMDICSDLSDVRPINQRLRDPRILSILTEFAARANFPATDAQPQSYFFP